MKEAKGMPTKLAASKLMDLAMSYFEQEGDLFGDLLKKILAMVSGWMMIPLIYALID